MKQGAGALETGRGRTLCSSDPAGQIRSRICSSAVGASMVVKLTVPSKIAPRNLPASGRAAPALSCQARWRAGRQGTGSPPRLQHGTDSRDGSGALAVCLGNTAQPLVPADCLRQPLNSNVSHLNAHPHPRRHSWPAALWRELHAEFKVNTPSPDNLARLLSGLANAEGGTVIVGVREPDAIVGTDPKKSESFLQRSIARLQGQIAIQHYVVEEGKSLGIIRVEPAKTPVAAPDGYFRRVGANDRPFTAQQLIARMSAVPDHSAAIDSERRLCEEVHLNLAYRWFWGQNEL